MRDKSYIQEEEFFRELSAYAEASRALWTEPPVERQKFNPPARAMPSERLIELFYKMCEIYVSRAEFMYLNQDLKNDMIANAMERLLYYTHGFGRDRELVPKDAFNYCSQIVMMSYYKTLKEDMKLINIKRKMLIQMGFDFEEKDFNYLLKDEEIIDDSENT